ncbi:hypothetical protein BC829DRAFT_428555 [Chytridium lagenaria]|nr:hypothetical protein BC829DRAFT_428555 [Chytridium lagenaria]
MISMYQLSNTMQVLSKLEGHPESLRMPVFKPLRALIFKLVKAASQTGINAVGRISEAVSEKRWKDALSLLSEMRKKDMRPKLGALQRWVRDCDAANSFKKHGRDTEVMEVLDSVLRTADPALIPTEKNPPVTDATYKHQPWSPFDDGVVRKSPDGVERLGTLVTPCKILTRTAKSLIRFSETDVSHYTRLFHILSQEPGPLRRPPNKHPMILHLSDPTTIDLTSNPPPRATSHPIPCVPSSFLIRDLFSAHECSQILRAMESPLEGGENASVLAHNVFWMADKAILGAVEKRIEGLLPEVLEWEEDEGVVKRKWRVYRYVPGHVYRPHIDGAWPKSGVDPESGEYIYDGSGGTTWSRMTFLIYLNQNFEGGVMDARAVKPQAGSVAGSGVEQGAKYIIRTDVLYAEV